MINNVSKVVFPEDNSNTNSELIYHKHKDMNYDTMTDIVINSIYELFKNDLN